MKRPRETKVYYQDFLNFCTEFPGAMDFVTRITLGEHPLPESADDHMRQPQGDQYYLDQSNLVDFLLILTYKMKISQV